MQMVNCDKCRKPIDHTHRFRILENVAAHMDCDDPFGVKFDFREKALPAFVCESPQKKAV